MREFVTMFHRIEELLPRAINSRNRVVIKRISLVMMMKVLKQGKRGFYGENLRTFDSAFIVARFCFNLRTVFLI